MNSLLCLWEISLVIKGMKREKKETVNAQFLNFKVDL